MASIESFRALKHTNLTATIERIDAPYSFWRQRLFGRNQILDKETFEVGTTSRVRNTAPFVRVGASAQMIRPRSSKLAQVEIPNIRLKDAYNPGENHFTRRVGEKLYDQSMNGRMQREITEKLSDMKRDIANTEEWMCAMAVQGTIAYDVTGGDSFELVLPDKAAVTVASSWTGTPDIIGDFREAKRSMAQAAGGGYVCTDVVLDQTAADALLADTAVRALLQTDLRVTAGGPLDLTNPFVQFGTANFLGTLVGINIWEYTASLNIGGSLQPLVRAGHAEFISATPGAENQFYYGAITDPRALESGGTRRRFFSKSWFDEDPGSFYILSTTRPMPFPRRADSLYSLQAI